MDRKLELLARIRGHAEQLHNDYEDWCEMLSAAKPMTIEDMANLPDYSIFDTLSQHVEELATALGFTRCQVEAARVRQQEEDALLIPM